MTQLLHLARKDVRRLRWDVGAWSVCIAARAVIATAAADVAAGELGREMAISQIDGLLALIEAALIVLIVSRLVHDEPLVGPDAFWLTRPIARSALMAEKLALAAAFLVIVPTIANAIVAGSFGTRPAGVAQVVAVSLLHRSLWVALLMVVAVLTPSFIRYVLAIVAIAGGLALLLAAIVWYSMMFVDFAEWNGREPVLPDPTHDVMGQVFLIAAALAVMAYQYRARRWRRAIVLAAAGVACAYFFSTAWPWSFAPPLVPIAAAAPGELSAITVSHDPSEAPRVHDDSPFSRTPPRKDISIAVTISGLPPDMGARPNTRRSRLELAGTTLEMNPGGGPVAYLTIGRYGSVGRGAGAALGGARVIGNETLPEDRWTRALRVSDDEFARYRREPGRLTADIMVSLDRTVLVGTLPLADGSSLEIGARRITIARVITRAATCTVLLRHTRVEPLFARRWYRELGYVLWNRSRNEAVAGNVSPRMDEGMYLGFLGRVTAPEPASGFILERFDLRFPQLSRPDAPRVPLDASWLGGAELAILESVPVRGVERTVVIDGFRMEP